LIRSLSSFTGRKLEELAAAIQKGDDQGSIAKFWNAADDKDSAEGFSNSLNEIMIDLMVKKYLIRYDILKKVRK
jgi:hypothetical protein